MRKVLPSDWPVGSHSDRDMTPKAAEAAVFRKVS